jgi:hypothetical protein
MSGWALHLEPIAIRGPALLETAQDLVGPTCGFVDMFFLVRLAPSEIR